MFGIIRGCCGSHDKPDPLLFIQVYRLISFYSLVKPPKGSNVDGVEIFESLLKYEDIEQQVSNEKECWKDLEDFIRSGENASSSFTNFHDYDVRGINQWAQAYFSGFLCRKIKSWTSCEDCKAIVCKATGDLPRDAMINKLNRGYLLYPSNRLYELLATLETALMDTVGTEPLNYYLFRHIVEKVSGQKLQLVGCEQHEEKLTIQIINYYIVTRIKIICKKYNAAYDDTKKRAKKHSKLSKL